MIWLLAPLTLGILWALYAISPARRAIRLLDKARAEIEAIRDDLRSLRERWRADVSSTANAYREEIYLERLRDIPLDELKKHATGLRLQPLRDIGVRNLADMQGWSQPRLEGLRGVGPKSAALIPSVVETLTSAAKTKPIPDPGLPFRHEAERVLVQAIYREIACERTLGAVPTEFADLVERTQQKSEEVKKSARFVRWIWTAGRGKTVANTVQFAREMSASLEAGPGYALCERVRGSLDQCRTLLSERTPVVELSQDYVERWNDYDLILTRAVGSGGRIRSSAPPRPIDGAGQNISVLEDSRVAEPDNDQVHVEFGRLVSGPPPVPTNLSSTPGPIHERSPLDPIRQAKRDELQTWINSVAPPRYSVSGNERETELKSFHIGSESVVPIEFSLPKSVSTAFTKSERWVPKDKSTVVQGITLLRGMVFIGRKTSTCHLGVIYPHLPVAASDAVDLGELRYWQGYDSLSCEARFAYLTWLADGATYTSNEQFAMLYFCGLERRLVLFAAEPAVQMNSETAAILEEVTRLAEEFKNAQLPLNGYAQRLHEFFTLRHLPSDAPLELSLEWQRTYELPWRFTYDLGRFARGKEPLPAEWALRWVQLDPNYYPRTPATRCTVEFNALFAALYARKYKAGLLLPSEGKPLTFEYTTASYHLRADCPPLTFKSIPDVRLLDAVRAELRSLADDVSNQLDAYSRFCGRTPDKSKSLHGYLLLPPEAWPSDAAEKLNEMRAKALAKQPLRWTLFLQDLGCDESLSSSQLRDTLHGLERAGLGIEPDILSGARRPKSDDYCIVFPLSGSEEAPRDRPEFKKAALSVTLMACVATANGQATDAEEHAVHGLIETWNYLHEDYRIRLSALFRLHVEQPAKLSDLKAKLLALSEAERTALLGSLSSIVTADRIVTAEEVRVMENIYRLFRLDPLLLYASLHQGNAQRPGAPVFEVPFPTAQAHEFHLDAKRIERLKAESAEVSLLLAQVFQGEEPDPVSEDDGHIQQPALHESIASVRSPIPGLGSKEAFLLTKLLEKPEWRRDELLKMAEEQKIMLEGAMEAINDAAFEAVGEPLLDGHDPIYVQTSLLENA